MQTRTYTIPVAHIAFLKKKIDALNKKASKLGCALSRIVLGEKIFKQNKKRNPSERDTFTEYQLLTVKGKAPVINGWSFVGKLEPHEKGVIVKSVPGELIPHAFHLADPMFCGLM